MNEKMQTFANWCRDERDAAAKSNENMRAGRTGFFSIIDGERRDDTPAMITHNDDVIRRMDELLAAIERDHGIRPT